MTSERKAERKKILKTNKQTKKHLRKIQNLSVSAQTLIKGFHVGHSAPIHLISLLMRFTQRVLNELIIRETPLESMGFYLFSFLFLPHSSMFHLNKLVLWQDCSGTQSPAWTHYKKLLPSDQPTPSRGQTETFPKEIWSREGKQPCWTGTVLKKHSQMEKQRLGS